MADLINWLHCHTTSSLQGLWKGRVSLLIHNIFLEDLKSQILAQNSEWEGRNKAHKHSGGIESNFSKKEKVHNSGREGGGPWQWAEGRVAVQQSSKERVWQCPALVTVTEMDYIGSQSIDSLDLSLCLSIDKNDIWFWLLRLHQSPAILSLRNTFRALFVGATIATM